MFMFSFDLSLVSLQEVMKDLEFDKSQSAHKYVKDLGISTFKKGNQIVMYKWDYELAKHVHSAELLKAKYPTKWKEMFTTLVDDKAMVDAVMVLFDPSKKSSNRTFIK